MRWEIMDRIYSKQNVINSNDNTPSDNADMSNDKGTTPRLKLMVFYITVTASKFIHSKEL